MLQQHGVATTLVGKHAEKLARASAHGVRTALVSDPLTPRAFDVVVEATGSPSGMELALRLLRPRGTLVLKSTYHGKLSLDAAVVVIDEITITAASSAAVPSHRRSRPWQPRQSPPKPWWMPSSRWQQPRTQCARRPSPG